MTPWRTALLGYGALAAVFLPLDATWLWWSGPRIYQPALRPLLAVQPDLGAAAMFYPLYLVGLLVFTLLPALADRSAVRSALRAALFGVVAYGTYDLTNQATLRDWPAWLTGIDLVWGAVVTTLATLAARGLLLRR